MTIEEIQQAVARGWCSKENEHKEMDVTLAIAISKQVMETQLSEMIEKIME